MSWKHFLQRRSHREGRDDGDSRAGAWRPTISAYQGEVSTAGLRSA